MNHKPFTSECGKNIISNINIDIERWASATNHFSVQANTAGHLRKWGLMDRDVYWFVSWNWPSTLTTCSLLTLGSLHYKTGPTEQGMLGLSQGQWLRIYNTVCKLWQYSRLHPFRRRQSIIKTGHGHTKHKTSVSDIVDPWKCSAFDANITKAK